MAGFRGVFTIPVTPFDERGEVDEASLRREVDWCVRAGAHGIVAPVNASEGPSLTDEERKRVTRLVVEATAGRIPVVIGVSGVSAQASALYARHAREAGADAVIAAAGDACKGIMGGIGGRYLLDEHRRGACGTMPACQSTDVHAAIWNALDAGREDEARRTFNRLLPLLNMEAAFGVALYKEV